MGGLKKSKGGKGKGGSKPKDGRPKEPKKQQPQQDEFVTQLPPQERVQAVRPFWETQSHEQRVDLLSIDIDELRARAKELTIRQQKQAALEAAEAELSDGQPLPINLEPTPEEILEEGIKRLQDKSTWKVWQWPLGSKEFFDADSFRRCVEEEHIEEDLRKLLPKDEGKPVEKPAEQQLRLRMTELLQKVHASTRALHDDVNGSNPKRSGRGQRVTPDQIHTAVRDTNIELITMMLEALEHEHEYLYHAVLFPITSYVCEMLPETMRDSTRSELFFEDLEKLPPDEVARICEWLTEKVDGFGAKIKPEAKDIVEEEEEEGIGDVDLFTLTEDGSKLMVNAKWLQHLQERLLGEDGHPRKVKDGEDPYNMGLVLEWVYGTIVSTAEKARDGAKRALGMRSPTAQQAHDQLMSALQDHQSWELRSKQAKELLKEMLGSRKEAAELATRYDIRPLPTKAGGSGADVENNELPDHVIISMLKHEVLLTRSKLHALNYEHHVGERKLRSLKSQLRQGEPEFERLKRELEEVKNQPRGLEGTFRTAAEMERHRAQLADAAIEEQLEVQTAFREHGSRLQGIYDNRQRTELEMARREQEMKQLQGWKATVQSLIERIEELTATHDPAEGDVEEGGQAATPDPDSEAEPASAETSPDRQDSARALMTSAQLAGQGPALVKLRAHFQKDVRRQLYTSEDDKTFYDWIQRELGQVEKKLDEGRAVLQHLEMQLINVACDDPGAAIGAQLALPILQERLDAKALEFAGKRAAEAEEALTKMEEENAERARLEREKKLKAKAKAKEKVRGEKERLAAEKAAQEAAERTASEQAALLRKQQEEEERKRRLQELEELRKAEEALMEARRKELLSEENGYWRRRMAQEQALQEHVVADSSGQDDLSETDADWVANGGEAATSKDAERRQQAQRTRRKRADWQDGEDMSDGSAAQDKHPMGNGIPHKAYRDGRDRDRDGRFPGSDPRDREDSRRYSSRSTPHSRGSRDERDNWGDGSGRRHGEHGRYGGENGRFSDGDGGRPRPSVITIPRPPSHAERSAAQRDVANAGGSGPNSRSGSASKDREGQPPTTLVVPRPRPGSGKYPNAPPPKHAPSTGRPVPAAGPAGPAGATASPAGPAAPAAPATPTAAASAHAAPTAEAASSGPSASQPPAASVAGNPSLTQPPVPAAAHPAQAVNPAHADTPAPGPTGSLPAALQPAPREPAQDSVRPPASAVRDQHPHPATTSSSHPSGATSGQPQAPLRTSSGYDSRQQQPTAVLGTPAPAPGTPAVLPLAQQQQQQQQQPAVHLPANGAPHPQPPGPGMMGSGRPGFVPGVQHALPAQHAVPGQHLPVPPPPPPPPAHPSSHGGHSHANHAHPQLPANVGPEPPHGMHQMQPEGPPGALSQQHPRSRPGSRDGVRGELPGSRFQPRPQHAQHGQQPQPHPSEMSPGIHASHGHPQQPLHVAHGMHDSPQRPQHAPAGLAAQHHAQQQPQHVQRGPPAAHQQTPQHAVHAQRVPVQQQGAQPGHTQGPNPNLPPQQHVQQSRPMSGGQSAIPPAVSQGPKSAPHAAQPNGPVPAGGAMPQYPGSYPQHAVPSHAPSTPPAMPAGRGVGSAVPMMPFPHPGAPVAHMMGQPPQMGAPQQMPNGGPYLVPYFPVPGMAIGMPAQLGDPSHGHPMGPGMQHMPNQPATHMQGPQGFGSPGAGSMLPQQGGMGAYPSSGKQAKHAKHGQHVLGSQDVRQVQQQQQAQHAQYRSLSGSLSGRPSGLSSPSTALRANAAPFVPGGFSAPKAASAPTLAPRQDSPAQQPPSTLGSTGVSQSLVHRLGAEGKPAHPPAPASSAEPSTDQVAPATNSIPQQTQSVVQQAAYHTPQQPGQAQHGQQQPQRPLQHPQHAAQPALPVSSASGQLPQQQQQQQPLQPVPAQHMLQEQPQQAQQAGPAVAQRPQPMQQQAKRIDSTAGQLPSPKGPLEHIETSESSAQVTVEERAQQAASVASAASSSSAQTRFGPDAPSWRHGHVLELPTADTATSSPSVSATDSPVSTSARGPGPDGRASPDPQRAATLAATSASGQAPRWSAIAAKEGAAGRPQPNGGMGTRSGSFGRLADSSGPRPQPSKALQGPQAPTEAQRQQRAAAREQTAWSSARSAAANGPTAAAPSARPPSASAATPAAGSAPAQMMPAERQVSPATTSAASTRTAGDKRKVMKAGGVVWEGLQDDMKRLKLVRGLSNDSGQYNCFLNVIIQSLWHLRSFREALLRLDPAGLERRGAGPGDVRVLRALWNIFHAFAHSPDDVPPDSEMAALDGLEDAGADQDAKRAKRDPADGKGWTVSPIELREALSSLDKGRVAVQFELTEMHDASEVLGEIFNCMHRAELGGLPEGAVDAQLPHRVKIRTGPASPAAAGMQPAMVLPSYASANGVSTAGGGVIPHTPMAAQAQPSARSSMVQDLFGLDVQVPCPADEDEDESAVKKARGSGGAVVGRWRMQQSKAQQAQQARAAPAGPKKPKDPNVTEVLQYMKYFHLVPAQGLQLAYNTLLDGSFEEMLQHAEAADALAHKSGGAGSVANGGLAGPDITLLRPPRVFNLAIVWDSPQAPADAISSTVDALGNALDLSRVFKGLPTAQRYSLRCVICYFGHHYQAYALSEELDLWLLFDDTNIKLIGDWRDVAFSMRKSRLQPSVLFYERR